MRVKFPFLKWLTRTVPYLFRFGSRRAPPVQPDSNRDGGVCLVICAWKRVWNLQPIISNALASSYVTRVLVSNNNTAYRLADWIRDDPRVVIMNQPKNTAVGIRLPLSAEQPEDQFLWIDDDVFLEAHQIDQLVEGMRKEPQIVHGIEGEVKTPGRCEMIPGYEFRAMVMARDGARADHVTNVYCFHRTVLTRSLKIAEQAGIPPYDSFNYGDDLVLSYGGVAPGRLHKIGSYAFCATWGGKDIAASRSADQFFQKRAELASKLGELSQSYRTQTTASALAEA